MNVISSMVLVRGSIENSLNIYFARFDAFHRTKLARSKAYPIVKLTTQSEDTLSSLLYFSSPGSLLLLPAVCRYASNKTCAPADIFNQLTFLPFRSVLQCRRFVAAPSS